MIRCHIEGVDFRRRETKDDNRRQSGVPGLKSRWRSVALLFGAEHRLVEIEENEERQESAFVPADQPELQRGMIRLVPERELAAVAQFLDAAVTDRALAAAFHRIGFADAEIDLCALNAFDGGSQAENTAFDVLVGGFAVGPPAPVEIGLCSQTAERGRREGYEYFFHFCLFPFFQLIASRDNEPRHVTTSRVM